MDYSKSCHSQQKLLGLSNLKLMEHRILRRVPAFRVLVLFFNSRSTVCQSRSSCSQIALRPCMRRLLANALCSSTYPLRIFEYQKCAQHFLLLFIYRKQYLFPFALSILRLSSFLTLNPACLCMYVYMHI